MRYFLILIFTITLISCKKDDKNTISELKVKSLNGDSLSYEKLHDYYFNNDYDCLLEYSYVLAERYNYTKAYYDVFEIIYTTRGNGDCNDYSLNCLNKSDKAEALKNLNKAKDMGYKPAIETYNYIYKKK